MLLKRSHFILLISCLPLAWLGCGALGASANQPTFAADRDAGLSGGAANNPSLPAGSPPSSMPAQPNAVNGTSVLVSPPGCTCNCLVQPNLNNCSQAVISTNTAQEECVQCVDSSENPVGQQTCMPGPVLSCAQVADHPCWEPNGVNCWVCGPYNG